MKYIFTLFLALSLGLGYSQVIYVNDDAAGANDGTSWTNAFYSLKEALDSSKVGDTIVVAMGTYIPDSSSRTTYFTMKDSTFLFGGFVGNEAINSSTIAARDLEANTSILSGDLNGDDYSGGNNSENSYHVFFQYAPSFGDLHRGVEINGFTIQGGNPDNPGSYIYQNGGAIYSEVGSGSDTIRMTIKNVIFNDNDSYSLSSTSALYGYVNYGASFITVENSIFCNNKNTVITNTCNGSGGNYGTNSMTFIHCDFINNVNASVFFNTAVSGTLSTVIDTKVKNCVLANNTRSTHFSSKTNRPVQFFNSVRPDDFTTRSVDSGSNYIGDVLLVDTSDYDNDTLYSMSKAIGLANNIYGYGANSGTYQGSGIFTPLSVDYSDVSFDNGCPEMDKDTLTALDTVSFSFIANDTNGVTVVASSSNQAMVADGNIEVIKNGTNCSIIAKVSSKTYGTAIITAIITSTSAEKDTIEFSITFSDPPVFTSITSNPTDSIFTDGSIDVTISGGTSPYDYYKDGFVDQYDDDQSYTYEYLDDGTYTIWVEDFYGCKSADTTIEITVIEDTTGNNTGVGTTDFHKIKLIQTNKKVIVKTDMKINSLKLYDLSGRLINSSTNSYNVDYENLKKTGVLIIHTDHHIFKKKIFKMKE